MGFRTRIKNFFRGGPEREDLGSDMDENGNFIKKPEPITKAEPDVSSEGALDNLLVAESFSEPVTDGADQDVDEKFKEINPSQSLVPANADNEVHEWNAPAVAEAMKAQEAVVPEKTVEPLQPSSKIPSALEPLASPSPELLPKSPEEQILESGVTADCRNLGGGCNETVFVNIVDDGAGIFKPVSGEREKLREGIPQGTYYKRERAAFLVSEMLGFDFVPPTVIREVDGKIGSAQQFIEETTPLRFSDQSTISQEDLVKLWIFDLLIGNSDRHSGNALVKDGRVIPIDHGLSFNSIYLRVYKDFPGKEIPEEIVENLQKFSDWENNRKVLHHLLLELLSQEEVDAFFDRLDKITGLLMEQKKIPADQIESIFNGGIEVWS